MNTAVNFRGRSGQAWSFQEMHPDSAWAGKAGVVLFAAPDAFGWRLIRVMGMTGKSTDVRPIWAFAEAERYGATAIFVLHEDASDARAQIVADIEQGFSPVCSSGGGVALAA